MEFITSLEKSHLRESLTHNNLADLEKIFKDAVGDKNEIDVNAFKKICPSKSSLFVERIFKIFDEDNSGSVSLDEFMTAMWKFSEQSPKTKLRYLFAIYDLNDDGAIQFSELRDVIRECMTENGLSFTYAEIDELTRMLFEDADTDGSGTITFQEFQDQLLRHPDFMENLTLSVERWLFPAVKSHHPRPQDFLNRFKVRKLQWTFIRNNLTSVIFLLMFLLVNAVLFISKAVQYWDANNVFVPIARACGQCLNFNSALVLVLVLRQTLTFLRIHGVSRYLPIDQHIYYHKLTAYFIVAYSILHATMHICNFHKLSIEHGTPVEKLLVSTEYGGWFGSACITGWILILILGLMFLSALPFVRRGGKFEVFHRLHQLAYVFWFCLLFHGPRFWMWVVAPAVLFIIEAIFRISKSFQKSNVTYVQEGVLLPSKVTHLVIKRPPKFDFSPGDYIYLNVPTIAKYEWHPFTISSAPEMEDVIWLHIRGVGGWTKNLYELFDRYDKEAVLSDELIKDLPTNKDVAEEISRTRTGSLDKTFDYALPVPSIMNITGQGAIPMNHLHSGTDAEILNHVNESDQNERFGVKNLVYTSSSCITDPGAPVVVEIPDSNTTGCPRTTNDFGSTTVPDMTKKNGENPNDLVTLRHKPPLKTSEDETSSFRRRMSAPAGCKFTRAQKHSVRVSVSSKSFRNCQTKIIMPTIMADDEDEAQLAPSGNYLKIKEEATEIEDRKEQKQEQENENIVLTQRPLRIYLDGPYGSPTRHIFQVQHAVLIATGIGVTPYASLLQSIMYKYRKSRHTCPNCKQKWTDTGAVSCLHLRKVDFFWLNRHQKCFEWFVSLLSELEIEQAELQEQDRFLDMHMYITSALHRTDMKAVGLQMAMDLLYEKEKRCLITGLKSRTQPGRPDWNKVFTRISMQNKGKVTVFFCGSQQLAKTLHTKCNEFGFKFRKEIF